MLRLAADPNRWISVTAPLSASKALRPVRSSRWRVITRCTTCSSGVTSTGCAASNRRSGIGNDSTHRRTGTRADDVIFQVSGGLRHAPRPARGAEPAALATEGDQFVVAAIGAAQAQEALRQDAALQEGLELVFDELRQAGTGGLFGLGEEALGVLRHQAEQRGLLGAVTRVVHRGTITTRPAGLGGVGLHALGMGSLGWSSFSRSTLQRIRH